MRKKLTFALVLALCMALLCLGAWADDTFSGGSGTEDDPYRISSAADMEALRDSVNSGNKYTGTYFLVTGDINLGTDADNTWKPIFSSSAQFGGVFDGDGHTISGLYVSEAVKFDNKYYTGLFGVLVGAEI